MSESVLKCPYSRPSKVVGIWMSFAKALVTYLPGPIISLNLKYFLYIHHFVSKVIYLCSVIPMVF